MNKKRLLRVTLICAVLAMLLVSVGATAFAQNGKNCWGVVSAQRATTEGGIGEHSASFDTPRLGLGNTAEALGFDHVSELGSFLASVDGIEETSC